MKDSGVEWIGEIPEEWEIVRIKNTAKGEDALFDDGDWIESSVIENDGIRYLTTGNVGEGTFKEQGDGFVSEKTISDLNCLLAYPGDLVISRLNKPIGRACRLPDTYDRYVVAVDIAILRPEKNRYCRDYLMFAMCIDGYSEDANMISRGATMPRISRTQLGRLTLPSPTYKEQKRISEYLNVNVAHINTIIEKTKESIEEYKKYKQSLITEVVTKGLNPEVPMRDSGVEWIGEIPEHWRMVKLKHVIELNTEVLGENTDAFYEFDYVDIGSVSLEDGIRTLQPLVFSEAPSRARRIAKKDDVLVSTVRTYLKAIAKVTQDELVVSTGFAVLKPVLVNPSYLEYLCKMEPFVQKVTSDSVGISYPAINASQIINIKVPLPPKGEQEQISTHLESTSFIIDQFVKQKERVILELESYKKSLIYDVVTGKKEIQ